MTDLPSTPGLRVFGGQGFQLTFANGCTASVFFSPANECSRKQFGAGWQGNLERHDSVDAEVMAWNAEGKQLVNLPLVDNDGEVLGVETCICYLSPDEVQKFLALVAAYSGEGELVIAL